MLDRRGFLAVTGAGLVTPALEWASMPDVGDPSPLFGPRITDGAVDTIEAITAHLRRLDEHLDRDTALVAVRQQLRSTQRLLSDHSYTETIGRRLYGVAAELLRLCGRLSYEDGRHGEAQRYLNVALRTAHSAGDRAQGANIVSYLADLEYDSRRMSGSLALAKAAQDGYHGDTPQVAARLQLQSALAYAATGDSTACRRELDGAFTEIGREPGDAPGWVHWVDLAMCHQFAAGCYFHLRDWPSAAHHINQAAEVPGSWAASAPNELGRIKVRTASVYARQGSPDAEAAVAAGHEALALFDSTGALPPMAVIANLRELAEDLRPFNSSPGVKGYLARSRELLARAA